jgi:hypothetical protein
VRLRRLTELPRIRTDREVIRIKVSFPSFPLFLSSAPTFLELTSSLPPSSPQFPGLAPDWLVGFSNLILRIVPSGSGGEYSRGKYNGDTGMLRSSNNGRALVRIKGEDMNIPFEYLVPVQPEEMGQRVLGIKGQWRGYEMTTVYRDDEQWQVEVRGEKQVLYAKELCRIAG